jgi:hypothetical protein
MPVDIKEDFATTMKRMQAAKPAIDQRQQQLLEERYDLSNHPASGATMSRGKSIQAGFKSTRSRDRSSVTSRASILDFDLPDNFFFPNFPHRFT